MAAIDFRSSIIQPVAGEWQTVLLKGPSGTGKTEQYHRLMDAGFRCLLGDVEAKVTTLSGLQFDCWPIRNPDFPMRDSDIQLATQDLRRLIEFIRTTDHGYDVVYVDSGMRYAEDLIAYLRDVKRMSGMEMWGQFALKLEAALKSLVRLSDPTLPHPVHVVVTWGVEAEKDWKGDKSYVPLVDGLKVKPKIDYWFDHVLYLDKLDDADKGTSEFVAYTTGTSKFQAKVSSGRTKFDPIIKNPNLADIIKQLQQASKPENRT